MAENVEYKVVESSVVTEDELSRILNSTTAEGWHFEAFQFAMRECSHRPSMVFAVFKRPITAGQDG